MDSCSGDVLVLVAHWGGGHAWVEYFTSAVVLTLFFHVGNWTFWRLGFLLLLLLSLFLFFLFALLLLGKADSFPCTKVTSGPDCIGMAKAYCDSSVQCGSVDGVDEWAW